MRRWKIIRISPDILMGLISSGDIDSPYWIKVSGLPRGYKVERVWYDVECHLFNFCVSHESFAPVSEGQIPPLAEILCESIDKDDQKKCGREFL